MHTQPPPCAQGIGYSAASEVGGARGRAPGLRWPVEREGAGRGGELAPSAHGSAARRSLGINAAWPADGAQCARYVHCERFLAGVEAELGVCGASGTNRSPDAVQIPMRASSRVPVPRTPQRNEIQGDSEQTRPAEIDLPGLAVRMVNRCALPLVTAPAAAPPVAPGRFRRPVVYRLLSPRAGALAGLPGTSSARARCAQGHCSGPAPRAPRERCRHA